MRPSIPRSTRPCGASNPSTQRMKRGCGRNTRRRWPSTRISNLSSISSTPTTSGSIRLPPQMADDREIARVERGIRLDLVIALCALLISTLAAGASFWQARVLQEQLGAQIWPYVGISEDFTGDSAEIGIANDGLGPAILRSATAAVDGV